MGEGQDTAGGDALDGAFGDDTAGGDMPPPGDAAGDAMDQYIAESDASEMPTEGGKEAPDTFGEKEEEVAQDDTPDDQSGAI
jgi:hypothetical protein